MAISIIGTSGIAFPDGTTRAVGTAANNLVALDSSGKLPAVDGSALTNIAGSGSLLRAPQILTSGTSYTTPANCTRIVVELLGGGGGGGGISGTGNNSISGGGAAGAYTYKTFTVTPSTAYTYAIGAGTGTATGAGSAGGDTTFTVGATTVTATGGTGGASTGGGLTSGVVSTNGDINFSSSYGFAPASTSAGVGFLTFGGSATPFGRGGARAITDANNNGNPATGYGSGGSGSNHSSTAGATTIGGAGTQGFIRIWEFA